ncbi:hypothetical protein GWI33_017622 [Rhynchophorus ferrugineus]|uniref:Uncharacterized protein n=1 Tax=Rhynchophorus ferrugineus TaxID=354439 RepID=A0A834M620_RHYFE|nr:hypothetical protein GWI33_017622 [Rhynchophorus ferrugineus]
MSTEDGERSGRSKEQQYAVGPTPLFARASASTADRSVSPSAFSLPQSPSARLGGTDLCRFVPANDEPSESGQDLTVRLETFSKLFPGIKKYFLLMNESGSEYSAPRLLNDWNRPEEIEPF